MNTRSWPLRGSLRAPSSLYAWTYENVLYRAWQRAVRGRPIGAHLSRLESTQWLPREELDRSQVAALRALLEHAGRDVPYWRALFRSIGFDARDVRSIADLRALPVLGRETIQAHREEMVDPALHPTNVRKGTSGSTGVPLRFEYCNGSEAWRQAVRLRGYSWAGLRPGLPTVYYWGVGPDGAPPWRTAKTALDRALRREAFVDCAKQDERSLRRFAATLSRLRPHAVVGYTQALAAFARWASANGARDWPDARVVCAAEAVLPGDRDALAAAFGPHVFETYGSRETMLVAAECDAHDGMHLSEENLIVEVLRDGREVGPGETGEVVVTDLHNYGMPFIRYSNGDLATRAPDVPCVCGRSLRRLARVDGRRADTLRDAGGDPIPGMMIIAALQEGRVQAFQATQARNGAVELQVVRGREWDPARFDAAVRRAETYLKGLPLRVVYVDEIPASASGKRRPVVAAG